MTDQQKQDFAFNWIDDHSDDIGFLPANFIAFAEDYIKWLATNDGSASVSDCTIRDWIITYANSDGTIQKAVVSGKDDDEAIANFQSEYHQEWRTIKAVV